MDRATIRTLMLPGLLAKKLRSSRSIHTTSLRKFSQLNTTQVLLEPVPESPGILCLSLNRPHSKNAISMQLLKEFKYCLETIRNDNSSVFMLTPPTNLHLILGNSVRSLIIRSSQPGSFCAGADLTERRTMTTTQVQTFLLDLRTMLSLLENLPLPTIAAIDGPALGGGLEIGLACDLRIAAADVKKIGLPETRLGIIPGAGGTQRATRLLGVAKAKDLIFTGRSLNSYEAKEIAKGVGFTGLGLIDYIAEPPQTAADRAVHLALEMLPSGKAPLAIRAAKLAISRASDLALESGLDFENACYQPLLGTKDRDEALLAFKEKRLPNFKGE
ncbi:hypothetical protein Clacol_001487 [Clathrus columnatus]|uniref:ClpP/crotonase n=1 Tax=Clathrus columnatus TaxID=1419009 RepID=A0AAV5A1I9_9AGAM|nr:hypothetical protein Clacol_001487 [Clathrus columnatus]